MDKSVWYELEIVDSMGNVHLTLRMTLEEYENVREVILRQAAQDAIAGGMK